MLRYFRWIKQAYDNPGTWMTVNSTHKEMSVAAEYHICLETLNNHLIPRLGAIPLQKLTPQHLQDYIARVLKEGRIDGKGGLSRVTVRYHINILSGALEHAVKMGYLARNVAHVVDLPKTRRQIMATMAREDIPTFPAPARGSGCQPGGGE